MLPPSPSRTPIWNLITEPSTRRPLLPKLSPTGNRWPPSSITRCSSPTPRASRSKTSAPRPPATASPASWSIPSGRPPPSVFWPAPAFPLAQSSAFPSALRWSPRCARRLKRSFASALRELGMVLPIGQMKSGNHHAVHHTIHAVAAVAHHHGAVLKVNLETCLLTMRRSCAPRRSPSRRARISSTPLLVLPRAAQLPPMSL